MLIIFDLDDTLIDTTGCITPIKLESALARMIQEGLEIKDFHAALEQLMDLDRTAESGRKALSKFLEMMQAPKNFLTIGLKEIYETSCAEISVEPTDGALKVLEELAHHHKLVLVTIGKENQQREKMKNAGIDSSIFSKIIVCEETEKGPSYQAIIQEMKIAPSEVIVCGDRIATDLSPARALGLRTVHIRWGRGFNSIEPKNDVDYTILKLEDIKDFIGRKNDHK